MRQLDGIQFLLLMPISDSVSGYSSCHLSLSVNLTPISVLGNKETHFFYVLDRGHALAAASSVKGLGTPAQSANARGQHDALLSGGCRGPRDHDLPSCPADGGPRDSRSAP